MSKKKFLFQKKEFDGWKTLNDTVMGGSSSAFCEISNSGLILKGNIVEKAGGFVSCRSSIYKPSLNVSEYTSFELNIDGTRKYKGAILYGTLPNNGFGSSIAMSEDGNVLAFASSKQKNILDESGWQI